MNSLLVVSQDKKTCESLKAILRDDFLVTVVEGEVKALSILREKLVNLVALDMPLRDTDVSTLAKAIRRIRDEAVIVVFSALKENVPAELRTKGVYEVVNKPFQRRELLDVMKKAQEKSRLLTELKFLRSQTETGNTGFEKNRKEEFASQIPYYYQEAIRKFSKALTYTFDPDKLLDSVVTAVAEIFEVNKVCVFLKGNGSPEYRVGACIGFREDFAGETKLMEGEGLAGWLCREGRILKREDLSGGEHFPERLIITAELNMLGAYLCLPLFTRGDMVAIISLGRKTMGDRFSYEDIRFLATMANYVAVSIYNSSLYEEVSFERNHHDVIMNNIPTGVITVDNDAKITMVNKAGRRILGLEEAEVIGEDIQKAGSIIADIILKTLRREKTYDRYEVSLPGRNVSLGVSASFLRKENGEVTGVVMVFTDLSKVKGLEEKVKKLEEEALWRKLTESIAHEVRNPLVSVRTFAQLFPDKYQDKEFRKDFYRIVNADISRLDELINKLERYAEPLSLDLQTGDLNSIVDEVLAGFKDNLAGEKITVKKNYSSGILGIVADGDKLAEAFSYIVENGIQAMPAGGTLAISTKIEKNADGEIVVKFSNTGRVIPKKDIERLFSPLFGGDLKGLGLGLPIAQKIVEAHEGRIEVDSGLGKGTSFKVFLRVSLDVEELKRKGIAAKLYPGMK